MKCHCKHEVDCHIYDPEMDAYYECEVCDCEAFETPTFNEDDATTPVELEF